MTSDELEAYARQARVLARFMPDCQLAQSRAVHAVTQGYGHFDIKMTLTLLWGRKFTDKDWPVFEYIYKQMYHTNDEGDPR